MYYLCSIFNVITGNTHCEYLLDYMSLNVRVRPTRSTQNYNFLHPKFCSRNYSQHEPSTAVINDFNKYYAFIDFNVSSQSIKNNLKFHLLNNY